jgi:hypothetical protein
MQRVISNQTIWHTQTGGRTNKVWRLVGEKDLICKLILETKTNPLFNNTSRSWSIECLALADGSDIAPSPISI